MAAGGWAYHAGGLDLVPHRVGRRPRLHLRGEPALPAQGRPALHHREKLRSGPPRPPLRCPGRAATPDVAVNLRVKEVRISGSERFVICFNPEGAERDAKVRERMLAQLTELIKDQFCPMIRSLT